MHVIRKQVTLNEEQIKYLDENSISLSKFLQHSLDKRMKNKQGKTR